MALFYSKVKSSFLSLDGHRALNTLFEIYKARDDLIRTYPEAVRGDISELLTWAVTSGVTIDSTKPLLLPHKQTYLKIIGRIHRYGRFYQLLEKLSSSEQNFRQTKIYAFAAYLAERFGCTNLIDVGCLNPELLVGWVPQFKITGIGYGKNFDKCSQKYENVGTWIKKDLRKPDKIIIPATVLGNAAIICNDLLEHLSNSQCLLNNIKNWFNWSPIGVFSTPENKSTNMANAHSETSNSSQENIWNIGKLEKMLGSNGFNVLFTGSTKNNHKDKALIAVIGKNITKDVPSIAIHKNAPPVFRVVAIMNAYNEEDIIVPSIKNLINQCIDVYVIDNWSTDSTYNLVREFEGNGVIGIERFPKNGPSKYYDLWQYLEHLENIAKKIPANWFIHHDVDEIRKSPWLGVNLKDGIYKVDIEGFNCIDHTVIEFPPTNNQYVPGSDFESQFRYFELATHPANFIQIKTWKNFGQQISLTESGGHEVQFQERRIYPYKFLLKHYPIRSQKHGVKKVFSERLSRHHPHMRDLGWGIHYDNIRSDHIFLREPNELKLFEEDNFNQQYLIERLSGIGIL